MEQLHLFSMDPDSKSIPTCRVYQEETRPSRPVFFEPGRIVLAKGSLNSPDRERFVRRICDSFEDAEVLDALEVPHNRVAVPGGSLLERHSHGKRTLVFGELTDSVRFSDEKGNTCPNYWHFSPYGFCPYGCHYCYLAGTIGVKFSPTVKIFVNLPEMLSRIDRIDTDLARPTAFFVGKLQDGLALDPLTGYSRLLVPFFAAHRHARLIVLTKAAQVDNLLPLNHSGHTILSWSVNPDSVCRVFDMGAPTLESRLTAMEKCAMAGYPIRAVIMPIVPVQDWRGVYREFIAELLHRVPLTRLTLGGICSYKTANSLMVRKISADNSISRNTEKGQAKPDDGRLRYAPRLRAELYAYLTREIHKWRPHLRVSPCFEEVNVCEASGLSENVGKCNCVL